MRQQHKQNNIVAKSSTLDVTEVLDQSIDKKQGNT